MTAAMLFANGPDRALFGELAKTSGLGTSTLALRGRLAREGEAVRRADPVRLRPISINH